MTLVISTCKLRLSFLAAITDVPTTFSMPSRSSYTTLDFVTSPPNGEDQRNLYDLKDSNIMYLDKDGEDHEINVTLDLLQYAFYEASIGKPCPGPTMLFSSEQPEQPISVPVLPSDTLTMVFQADGTMRMQPEWG
ncbi:hypothetical protein DVH24_026196 [Malus domestica]|uniref:Uncharacterized protein n=1 Tax=Malus domestica TaxID=3750 RepID=A0A498KFE1_MALDO|nr:hypothetical protein DVH24_026196 [Malus domestica]